jgi:CRISPR-associated protein Csb2
MIVEIELLVGRLHATPWDRHVNEAVPEWPPSPFRLLRALVDAWHRKHPELSQDVVERMLVALSPPPRYWLPRARTSHTRSYLAQNREDPSDKKLVFDGFVVVDRGSKVLVGWPGAALDGDGLTAARLLFSTLNYLGRSESWIAARVIDDRAVDWNCVPLGDGSVGPGKEVVRVSGIASPEAFAARGFVPPATGRTKPCPLPWIEALTWGSAETIAHTMNRPPAMEPLFYIRDANALDARPIQERRPSLRVIEAARLGIDTRVKVPLTEALRIAEAIRGNLMGALKRVTGSEKLSTTFTGKDADGKPAEGHQHVSILPLDEDEDGFIDTVLITCPQALSPVEQRAIDRLLPVRCRNGHPLILTPLRFGRRDELLMTTTVVVSATPFAPSRHWRPKRDGDFDAWLLGELRRECEWRKLPLPMRIERITGAHPRRPSRRWLDFRRARRGESPQPAYGLRAVFEEPVLAPFSLGYASHFGLGMFIADRRRATTPKMALAARPRWV